MGKHRSLAGCRKSRDFVAYAVEHGAEVVNGGRHGVKVSYHGCRIPVPDHPGELATGTRRAIVKSFIAIGLSLLALALIV